MEFRIKIWKSDECKLHFPHRNDHGTKYDLHILGIPPIQFFVYQPRRFLQYPRREKNLLEKCNSTNSLEKCEDLGGNQPQPAR